MSAAFLGSPVPATLSLHDAEGALVATGSLAPVGAGEGTDDDAGDGDVVGPTHRAELTVVDQSGC